MGMKKTNVTDLLARRTRDRLEHAVGDALAVAPTAEAAVISSICMDGERGFLAYDEARQVLSAESFRSPAYRAAWRGIAQVMEAHGTLTPPLLIEQLRRDGALEHVDGDEGVLALFSADDLGSVTEHAREVQEAYARREYATAGARMMMDGAQMEVEEMQRVADSATDRIRSARSSAHRISGEDVMKLWAADLEACTGRGEAHDFTLGLGIDERYAVQHGQYLLFCAPEKHGKSTFLMAAAAHAALHHNALVDIWSAEMHQTQVIRLLASYINKISRRGMRTGKVHTLGNRLTNMEIMAKAMNNFSITCSGSATALDIAAETNVRHATHRESIAAGRPHLVIVDYIQTIKPGTRTPSRREAIEETSERLRDIAKEERIRGLPLPTIMAAAHLDTRRSGRLPDSDSIYGSSQPAKDADLALCINNIGVSNSDEEKWGKHFDMNISRCRHELSGPRTWALEGDLDHMNFKMWEGQTFRELLASAGGDGDRRGRRGGRGGNGGSGSGGNGWRGW